MVRPLKPDRESIALTTVRVSVKTKQLLQQLKTRHGFATIDQVIKRYLASASASNDDEMIKRYVKIKIKNRATDQNSRSDRSSIPPLTQQQQQLRRPTPEDIANYVKQQPTAEDIYNYTKQQPDIDKLIKESSKQLTRYINKSSPNHYSTKPVNRKSLWLKPKRRRLRLRQRRRRNW